MAAAKPTGTPKTTKTEQTTKTKQAAKTAKTAASVADFLAAVPDPRRRADARTVCDLITEVTGVEPAMWGASIVGFGSYHYVYASGRSGDWPPVGLSPRKQALTVYLSSGAGADEELLSRLGPHTTGQSCLYIKTLADVDQQVLRELVARAFERLNGRTITTE